MLEEVRKHIEELIARYEAAKVENERLREELHAWDQLIREVDKCISWLES